MVAAFDVPFDVFAFDDACSCREVIRCFFRRPGTDSVMSFVLRGALKLTFGVVLVDRGVVQAAVRFWLMSPAQVG